MVRGRRSETGDGSIEKQVEQVTQLAVCGEEIAVGTAPYEFTAEVLDRSGETQLVGDGDDDVAAKPGSPVQIAQGVLPAAQMFQGLQAQYHVKTAGPLISENVQIKGMELGPVQLAGVR